MPDDRIPPLRLLKMIVLSIFGWFTVFLASAFFGSLICLLGIIDKTGRLGHLTACQGWARLILAVVGVKVRVKGVENVVPRKPYVIAANHLSNFDIIALMAKLPVPFRWVAKKELFRIPIFGWGMARAGYVKIDRENKEKAWSQLNEAKGKLDEGVSLMFFPEGTRSPDGELKRFKTGAFVLSINTGVPVLPVAVVGAHEIMQKKSLLFQPGTVDVIISPAIEPSGFELETKHEFAQVVRNEIGLQVDKSRVERLNRAARLR